jgi:hypothetical protein
VDIFVATTIDECYEIYTSAFSVLTPSFCIEVTHQAGLSLD